VVESIEAITLLEDETHSKVYVTGPQYVLMFFAEVNPVVNETKTSFDMSVITGTITLVGSHGSLIVT
jgi:hypothetical protein